MGWRILIAAGLAFASPAGAQTGDIAEALALPAASELPARATLRDGDDDSNVDFAQSLLLARALRARRIPHEELVFPNERHDSFRYADWLAAYRATIRFFDEHLK